MSIPFLVSKLSAPVTVRVSHPRRFPAPRVLASPRYCLLFMVLITADIEPLFIHLPSLGYSQCVKFFFINSLVHFYAGLSVFFPVDFEEFSLYSDTILLWVEQATDVPPTPWLTSALFVNRSSYRSLIISLFCAFPLLMFCTIFIARSGK